MTVTTASLPCPSAQLGGEGPIGSIGGGGLLVQGINWQLYFKIGFEGNWGGGGVYYTLVC